MGARGPQPTPTPVLDARGSWRAKERKREPKYPPGLGSPPSHLGKEARAEWRRVAAQLTTTRIAQRVDRAALAVYCEAWGEHVELCKLLAEGELEGPRWRFTVAAKNEAARRVLQTADRFGFSPAARARLQVPEDNKGADSDEEGKAKYFRVG